MAPKYVSGCVKILLKLTVLLMFEFSTSSTKQCTTMKTERDDYVIRNVGIKLCQLKCAENDQCLSIEYNIETLTCRLSRAESKEIKKKEGHVILARDHSHVPTGSCTSSVCSLSQRCLKTRSGKGVCVQDEKQNDPEKYPQHKVVNSSLHEACKIGDLNRVRHILSRSLVDINSTDEKHGRTPLMVAAQEGHCSIFDFLISKGANMSEVDNDCKNALHWACKGGHVGMEECVLRQYDVMKSRQKPVLLQAVSTGKRDVFDFLVCTGSNASQADNLGDNVLHWACSGGGMAMVKYLVSQGSVDINSRDKKGVTPLMIAAIKGHKDVFEFLVSMGANVSRVDNSGNNALHFAVKKGHMSVMKFLVSQGSVDINSRRKDGSTPLMEAVLRGKRNVFEFLMSMGANASHVDVNGRNILHLVSLRRRVEVVKYILSKNLVDINARDKGGNTAAMIAKRARRLDVYNLLVSRGCPVT